MKVLTVPVRKDNYAYVLVDETTKQAAAIDPYNVPKIKAVADDSGLKVTAAITTHHHLDHSGGNEAFAKAFPDAIIYGGSTQVPALNHLVKDKDVFTLGENIKICCLATPCHTQDSICYHVTDKSDPHAGAVFTGDTLFIGGCGRFFEGTAMDMHQALSYLSTLPDDTITYVGHEYTAGNLAFAKTVEPEHKGLKRLEELVKANQVTTGKSTIGDEKDWNVFMRLDSASVRKATGLSTSGTIEQVMNKLRELKNKF